MKRLYIIALLLMTSLANGRQTNYYIARTGDQFNCLVNDEKYRMAVALFYSSTACDNYTTTKKQKNCEHICSLDDGKQCRNARQEVISYQKQFKIDWYHDIACLEQIFRQGSCNHSEVRFILVDVSRPANKALAHQLNVDPDRPIYIMFKDGQPIDRKYVNMKQLAQSSLFTFVNQYAHQYMPKEMVCVQERDMFQPNARDYSVLDWGGPFYYRALGPENIPYFDALVD